MFYYWGTRNDEGGDDGTAEKATHDPSVIKISCPKSIIQDKQIGRCLGVIGENGNVSVLQYGDGQGNDSVMQSNLFSLYLTSVYVCIYCVFKFI